MESPTGANTQRKAAAKEGAFDTATVLTLMAAHGGHDIYTAFLAPLLPLLIAKLSIPLAAAGALQSIFRMGSLAQPFLGAWVDRADGRYFVIAAPTITAVCMSLLGVAPNYLTVAVLLAIAGLSHATFHPSSGAIVTRASGRTWGRGISMYAFGGSLGFTVGPLFIVSLVTWLGLEMTWVAAAPGVLLSVLLYWRLRKLRRPRVDVKSAAGIWELVKAQRRSILLLSGFVLFRSTSSVSFTIFYPTFLTNQGSTLLYAGLAMTVYQFAGGMGSLVGGTLSDVVGRRKMLVGSQLLSGPLLYLALASSQEPFGLAILALGAAMTTSASPVQMALFHELLPTARATATGIWSLLSFEGSLATTIIVGAAADQIGLGPTLGFSVLASMLSIPFILALHEPKRAAN